MDNDSKKAAAAKLREDLRNGRNRTPSQAGGTTDQADRIDEGFGRIDADQGGATVQNARGTARTLTPTGGAIAAGHRQPGDHRRSTPAGTRPVRGDNGRFSKSISGAVSDSAASESGRQPVAAVGRLETDEQAIRIDKQEPTFERQDNGPLSPRFKEDYFATKRNGQRGYALKSDSSAFISLDAYRALASRKQAEAPPEKRFFGKGKTLSATEAEELAEPLAEAIRDEFHIVDQALWLRCPQIDERDIWGDVSDQEVESLVELLLKGGQRNAATAAVVRGMVDLHVYAVVGSMFAPRIQATVTALQQTPKRGQPMVKISPFRRKA